MVGHTFKTNGDVLKEHFPDIADASAALRKMIREAGPLDAKTRELILIGGFTAARIELGLKIHAKIAVEEGATREELRHAVLLCMGATQTISPVVAALQWIDEALLADEVVK